MGEGVVAGEAEQHAERAGGELRVHPDPVVEGPPRDVELLAPQVGADWVCTIANDSGRSISAASRTIQSSSFNGPSRLSPAVPAGATSNTA